MLLEQAWQVFLEHPLTGVGAGQFENFSWPGKAERWRVTHNALLQVASEIGIFGVIAFVFLIWRGFAAAWSTRRALAWTHRRIPKRRRGAAHAAVEDGLEPQERVFLETTANALLAGMVGWFVCAQFASVAFNWTFYYVVGLAVCTREVVRARAQAYAEAKALTGDGVVAA